MRRLVPPLLLLALALGVRLGYVAATPHYAPNHDDGDYVALSRSIARTGAYPTPTVWLASGRCPAALGPARGLCPAAPGAPGARPTLRPTAYRPPGYPYALAGAEKVGGLLGVGPVAAARVFQALLGTLVAALVGLLARRLWNRRVAMLALAIAAVEIPLVLLSGTLLSESLFVALELGALVAALDGSRGPRTRRRLLLLVLAGVLTGLAALTRTNGLVLLAPVALLAWQRSRDSIRGLAPLIVVVAALASVGVWTARNAAVLGNFVPVSTETGGTLVGTYNPTSRADHRTPANWLVLSAIPLYASLAREQTALSETAIDARLRGDALGFVRAHPGYVATVWWWNTLRLLDLTGSRRVRFGASTVDVSGSAAVAGSLLFHILALLALAGVLLPAARRVPGAIWLAPGLLWMGTVLVTSETPRFRAGIEPFAIMLAALALESARAAAAGRGMRPRFGRQAVRTTH